MGDTTSTRRRRCRWLFHFCSCTVALLPPCPRHDCPAVISAAAAVPHPHPRHRTAIGNASAAVLPSVWLVTKDSWTGPKDTKSRPDYLIQATLFPIITVAIYLSLRTGVNAYYSRLTDSHRLQLFKTGQC